MLNEDIWEKAADLLLPLLCICGFILLLSGGIFVAVKRIDPDQWLPGSTFAMGVLCMCMAHTTYLSRRIEKLESKQSGRSGQQTRQ